MPMDKFYVPRHQVRDLPLCPDSKTVQKRCARFDILTKRRLHLLNPVQHLSLKYLF